MIQTTFLISEAAKEVKVENHVLRYWEEELKLPVKRTEQGHRYYTKEDIERFIYIKQLKEEGLQLKAIRNLLEKQGVIGEEKGYEKMQKKPATPQLMVLNSNRVNSQNKKEMTEEEKQEKMYRLQLLLKAMISEAVSENNKELGEDIKEIVQKEMDYQFRMQEEREEEREKKRVERENTHYSKIDELIRDKFPGKRKKHSLW